MRRRGLPPLLVVLLGLALAPAVTPASTGSPLPWTLRALGLERVEVAPPARVAADGPVVAIVDTGVDLHHAHLRRTLWTNPRETPGNGTDDDGNGHVDDVHGIDVLDPARPPQDDNGHGTAAASIVVGRGAGRARRGVAPGARIMAVKVLDAEMSGDTGGVAEGVRYAVRNGADIVNLSLAAGAPDPELHAALVEARDRGVLVVAAAGNHGADLRRRPAYPAVHADAAVVSVAALDRDGDITDASARGPLVAVGAPGEDVPALGLNGRVRDFSGTSAAAPHVSGALAVLLERSSGRPAASLRGALLRSARRARLARKVRYGAVDVRRALRRLLRSG